MVKGVSITDALLSDNGLLPAVTPSRFRIGAILDVPQPVVTRLLCAVIALKLVLLFLFAWNSRFVMDEFVQLGWAKYLGNGLFHTVWHAKAVGYVLFFKLTHLIGENALSILLTGRMQVALLACGTLAIIYRCARALGHDRPRALLVILVLLCFSNFIERIFRTIAEPLATFLAAAALFVLLRGDPDRPRTLVAAGVLSGLSFLATQKAVYFDVALGMALVADAALARQYRAGILRGAWLLLGWMLPIIAYCLAFGGSDPGRVAMHLAFGPVEVATTGGAVYSNLRSFVWQTLIRNSLLYLLCLAGLLLALSRLRTIEGRQRIALIFTAVVTLCVFAHNQPWPYVFIMALPFLALWAPLPFDRVADPRAFHLGCIALVLGVATSFVRNAQFLAIDNSRQLEIVARAEALVKPDQTYFDGVGMLPNRREPSTLWLDRKAVSATLAEGERSEAYRIFAETPPKIIIWSTRMQDICQVVAPLLETRYVQVAPNIRLAGRKLRAGRPAIFDVPIAGRYALYDRTGAALAGQIKVDGTLLTAPVSLPVGRTTVSLRTGSEMALLLPEGRYAGLFASGPDHAGLFDKVYD